MSIEIFLEMESGQSFEESLTLLDGIPSLQQTGDCNFYMPRSKIHVFVHRPDVSRRKHAVAEGMEASRWELGMTFSFNLGSEGFDVQLMDIKIVIDNLLTKTNLQFVLSFQYEKIYACRDEIVGIISLSDLTGQASP